MTKKELMERLDKVGCGEQAKAFFANCPALILNYLTQQTINAQQKIIEVDRPNTNVYFLLKGRMQAVEETVSDMPYSFAEIEPFDIVGDYELFTETADSYVTVVASQKSVCFVLPATYYMQWIKSDNTALFLRTKQLLLRLAIQTKWDRRYFFMEPSERCLFVLYQACLQGEVADGQYTLAIPREQLATRIGSSLRTTHRIVQQLAKEGKIYLSHGKLCLSVEQFYEAREAFAQV